MQSEWDCLYFYKQPLNTPFSMQSGDKNRQTDRQISGIETRSRLVWGEKCLFSQYLHDHYLTTWTFVFLLHSQFQICHTPKELNSTHINKNKTHSVIHDHGFLGMVVKLNTLQVYGNSAVTHHQLYKSKNPILFFFLLCSHLHNWCSHLHLRGPPRASPLPPLSFSHLWMEHFHITWVTLPLSLEEKGKKRISHIQKNE